MFKLNIETIIIVALSVLLGCAAFFLMRKGTINEEVLAGVRILLENLHPDNDGTFMERLAYYCALAVAAVEQLALSGQFEGKGEAKKEAAIGFVKDMAREDGYDAEIEVVDEDVMSALIESAVFEMKQN